MMGVVPSIGFDQLLLGVFQGRDRFLGMATELDVPVVGLGLFDVPDGNIGGAQRVANIRVMDVVGQGNTRDANGCKRSND